MILIWISSLSNVVLEEVGAIERRASLKSQLFSYNVEHGAFSRAVVAIKYSHVVEEEFGKITVSEKSKWVFRGIAGPPCLRTAEEEVLLVSRCRHSKALKIYHTFLKAPFDVLEISR